MIKSSGSKVSVYESSGVLTQVPGSGGAGMGVYIIMAFA